MKKEEKNRVILIPLFILLLITLFILLLYGIINKDKPIKDDFVQEYNKTSEDYKDFQEEKTLEDHQIIEDIHRKIEYLNTRYYDEEQTQEKIRSYNEMGFREYVFQKDLDDKDKLNIVLSLNDNHFSKLTHDITKTNIDEYFKENFSLSQEDVWTELDVTILNDLYYDLFNNKPYQYYSYNGSCPSYLYDDLNKMYFRISECGGTSRNNYFMYLDTITYKDDEVYVYTYWGSLKYDYDKNYMILYKDLVGKDIYKENTQFDEVNTILKDDYKSFCFYKYTFKRNSQGNYYFVNIKTSS